MTHYAKDQEIQNLSAAPRRTEGSGGDPVPALGGQPLSLVLIDDCDADRYFFKRCLRKIAPEAEVVEFAYAEDALRYIRSPGRPAFDALFVDINMPRQDGFEFADAYRELYPELRGEAPFFICTSSINPQDRSRAQEHGTIDGFCEKPMTPDQLLPLLAQVRRSVQK